MHLEKAWINLFSSLPAPSKGLECSPMARETWVQSQVESYQRLKKMVLDASLLSTQHYKVRIKGKVEQSRKGVAPSPTHWCSSYRKGSLRVTLDYGRQLYFFIYNQVVLVAVSSLTLSLSLSLSPPISLYRPSLLIGSVSCILCPTFLFTLGQILFGMVSTTFILSPSSI